MKNPISGRGAKGTKNQQKPTQFASTVATAARFLPRIREEFRRISRPKK
jgi:hypothetical protein